MGRESESSWIRAPLTDSSDGGESSSSLADALSSDKAPSDHHKPGSSSIYKASFNFINSIVGAGIIGMPFAMGECGLVGGPILMMMVAVLVGRSVTMLIECGVKEGHLDYEDLAHHLLGKPGYYAALASMFLFAFGAQTAYLIIIGDTIPTLTNGNRQVVIGLVALFVVLPLCLLKDMTHLSYTSLAAILFDLIIIVIVIAVSPDAAQRQDITPSVSDGTLSFFSPRLFAGIGTLSFAFVCMHNSFIVYRSLKERTEDNWRKVAYGSVTFCLCIAMTFGMSGYIAFGDLVEGDILNNFILERTSVDFARALLATCMIFVYPMEMFVSRHCAVSLLKELGWVAADPVSSVGYAVGSKGGSSSSSSSGGGRTPSEEGLAPAQPLRDSIPPVPDSPGQQQQNTSAGSDADTGAIISDPNGSGSPGGRGVNASGVDPVLDARASHLRSSFVDTSKATLDSEGGAAMVGHWCTVCGVHVHWCMEWLAVFVSKPHNRVHVGVTVVLWLVTVMLSLSFDDLGVVLALTGAIAASCLGYILPAMIYIKCYGMEFSHAMDVAFHTESPSYDADSYLGRVMAFRQFFMPVFMIGFGFLACVLGIITVFTSRE
jgi:sodium-coupled neutral amino acid transporter 11